MRWRRSGTIQVQDRRGAGGGMLGRGGFGGLGGGGGIPIPMGGGIGGIIVVIIFIAIALFGGGGGLFGGGSGDGASESLDPNDEFAQFVNAVTVDIQGYWDAKFAEEGRDYGETELVLFSQATQTGCGTGSAQTGPFYCPVDELVYLDDTFFQALEQQLGAEGDFAQAYVIAHEFGHHVEDELGTLDRVQSQMQSNPDAANELSIRLELMADCYAGMWAYSVWNNPDSEAVESITQADIQEGLDAAAAVGDDRIQEKTTGRVDPESWNHGSSEMRMRWFTNGFESGDFAKCDTFAVDNL